MTLVYLIGSYREFSLGQALLPTQKRLSQAADSLQLLGWYQEINGSYPLNFIVSITLSNSPALQGVCTGMFLNVVTFKSINRF